MFKRFICGLIISVTSYTTAALASVSIDDLQAAENYRLQYKSALIRCSVDLYQSDVLQKTRLYDVYRGDNNQSLVIFKSAADAGQKVLMNEDNFWMFMPKSRRPIRITPMQKLLGEASLGDVASLSWSEQYEISSYSEADGKLDLVLTANSASASYQKIELQLQASDRFPLKANLYLKSGMLSKTAQFVRGQLNDRDAVVNMVLVDRMRSNNKTVIKYQEITETAIPSKLFNPQILIRSDLEQILTQN